MTVNLQNEQPQIGVVRGLEASDEAHAILSGHIKICSACYSPHLQFIIPDDH